MGDFCDGSLLLHIEYAALHVECECDLDNACRCCDMVLGTCGDDKDDCQEVRKP